MPWLKHSIQLLDHIETRQTNPAKRRYVACIVFRVNQDAVALSETERLATVDEIRRLRQSPPTLLDRLLGRSYDRELADRLEEEVRNWNYPRVGSEGVVSWHSSLAHVKAAFRDNPKFEQLRKQGIACEVRTDITVEEVP